MGRSIKERSNAELAQPHAEGAAVSVIQVLAHDRYGCMAYARPRHWSYHYLFAQRASRELAALHQRVLSLEPAPNAMRLIDDDALLQAFYEAGNAMVSHAVRAVQHLAEEMEQAHNTRLRGTAVEERINEEVSLWTNRKNKKKEDTH